MWQNYLTLNSGNFSGGSVRYATSGPAKATFLVKGTGFDVVSTMASSYGVATITVDGAASAVNMYSSTTKYKMTTFSRRGLSDTTHTVTVEYTGIKGAGNGANVDVDAVDVIGTLVADTVAPVTTGDVSDEWRSSGSTVTLTALDSGWGTLSTRYRINGSALSTYTAPFNVNTEGVNTIEFFSTDRAGNIEETKTATVRIDKTAPSVSDDSGSVWTKGPVTVHLDANDVASGLASVLYSTDGSAPSLPYLGSIALSDEGTTTIKYQAIDAVGNESPVKSATVRIDDTAPVTTDDVTDSWHESPVDVTLTSIDALSGVADIVYTLDGSAETTYKLTCVDHDGGHTHGRLRRCGRRRQP